MKIVQYPHPALRHKARPVAVIDNELRAAAARMRELMNEKEGLGLAAPQVALTHQLLVLNVPGPGEDDPYTELTVINPVILEQKGVMDEDREGCLSFPGLYQKVRRAKTVKVRAYTIDGKLHEATYSDLAARLWQHEVDHLHGVLFIDKMGPLQRVASRAALKEFEEEYRDAQKRGTIPPDDEIKKSLEAAAPVL